ncbi:MAG: CheR family methyltransferase [Blastocatellia bacterium]
MPRSAINAGVVDFVLPVAEMPAKLLALRENALRIELPLSEKTRHERGADALRDLLALLRTRTGHDFSNYKRSTVLRRIERRLQVNEVRDIPAYLELIREQPLEVQLLLHDLLISVTNFFRDPEAFMALAQQVMPNLFAGRGANDQVRVWVAGCATGEEAYSMAMLLTEYADQSTSPPKIQVFATDIDEEAITTARNGVYPDTIAADVSPERLKRFFNKEAQHYRIRKEVREEVLFASHNVLRDPPFSRIDLISCRNLLIYLNRETQERILEIFHFALRPDGYLFLGSSESAEGSSALFAPFDKKYRIYKRRTVSTTTRPLPALPMGGKWEARLPQVTAPGSVRPLSVGDLHNLKLLERYIPPSVLVNEEHDIVHISGQAGRFLRFADGEPSRNLLKAVHPMLRLELRAALFAALQKGNQVESRRIRAWLEGESRLINLTVEPLTEPEAARGFMIVIFEEIEDPLAHQPEVEAAARAGMTSEVPMEPVVRQLEEELQRTREQLRATIEQYETSVEELKASNEELQAINEELRSATEELETSKEELQSVNEELTTVNHELKEKIEEVSRANSDLQNLLASTEIGTVFLDRALRIKRYTPRVEEIYNIIPSDLGRPLEHLTHKLEHDNLSADAEKVLTDLRMIEREIRSLEGRWYLARLLPYRTLEDRIDGVVLTFVDITQRKQAETDLLTARNLLEERVKERTQELRQSYQALEAEVIERRATEEQNKVLLQQLVTAQENERQRISRELHDQMGQQLTALRLAIESLRTRCGNQAELGEPIERIQNLTKGLERDVDFLAWELRPSVLEDLGLTRALAGYLQEWSRHFNITADFHTASLEAGRLVPEAETALYRAAQEALNNIARHAQASQVGVLLESRDNHAVLIIEDNGIGFDPQQPQERGLGLIGMRERAAIVGGTIEIESAPGRGTTIFIKVPYTAVTEGGPKP